MTARFFSHSLLCLILIVIFSSVASAEDRILADFESDNYGEWSATREAFGSGPAAGTIGSQQNVSGFLGRGLVNTYIEGDPPMGTLTSPEFVVDQSYLNFLIGGGSHNSTRIELEINGEVCFKASGQDNERLDWKHFDLREYQGETARLRIVDEASSPWGHVNVDQITLSAAPQGPGLHSSATALDIRQEMIATAEAQGFSKIVFATREVDGDGHWYANFSYWSSNPERKLYHGGGRLCVLDLETGEVEMLIEDLTGGIRDPQMHYDGERILFSYRKGGQPYFHLYEINIDGSGLRQITDGPFDDLESIYLPDGDILFCSSRCNRMVNCWHVRVAIIYRCDTNGENMRALSSNIEQDNTPWLLADGRILHQRWEYIDRSQVRFHHLWTMNPDGTNQMVYFGNMHGSTVMIDAKPIPNSTRVATLFSPGHGQKEHAGFVTIVDPSTGPDNLNAAHRISDQQYRDPYPLSEDLFIVARNKDFGFLTGDGRYEPVWSMPADWDTETLWVHEPRPLAPREREQVIPSRVDESMETGTVILDNVYIGRNMGGIEPGEIKKLLILEALAKPVNFSGGWEPLTYGGTFTLERILGTVPVEEDGSAHFELPAVRSIFFVALDENDMSVKRMQSFMTVQPGEMLSCIGCHEERVGTPSSPRLTLAMVRPPSQIEPLEGIPGVIDFPRDVQPILDRHCVDCHDYEKGEEGGPRDGGVILTGDRAGLYSHSYYELSSRFEFMDGLNADGNRPPRSIGTSASPIMQRLNGEHYDVQLSAQEIDMIRYWIESAAVYPGTYAALGCGMPQGRSVAPILERRCAECHTNDRLKLPVSPLDIIIPGFWGGGQKDINHPNNRRSSQIVYNLSRPEYSLMLMGPLSESAGGFGTCRPLNVAEGEAGDFAVFEDKSDSDYIAILEAIEAGHDELNEIKRFDMPGFRPNVHYIREMQVYGVLPWDLDENAPLDPYEIDELYWQSLWHDPTEY